MSRLKVERKVVFWKGLEERLLMACPMVECCGAGDQRVVSLIHWKEE